MKTEEMAPADMWQSLKIARLPLSYILNPELIQGRKNQNQFTLSDTAFVHRMFGLFFGLDYPPLKNQLLQKERDSLDRFQFAFNHLPWKEVPDYPHISELDSTASISLLFPQARNLDLYLKRRTSYNVSSLIYRIRNGLPVIKPQKKN